MASLIQAVENSQMIVQVRLAIPVPEGVNSVWLPARALIDTGANISGVSNEATTRLSETTTRRGLPFTFTHGQVITPNQPEDNPEEILMFDVDVAFGIEVESTIKNISRKNTNWIYHTLRVFVIQHRSEYDMLLGMDFLQHCHLSLGKGVYILSN